MRKKFRKYNELKKRKARRKNNFFDDIMNIIVHFVMACLIIAIVGCFCQFLFGNSSNKSTSSGSKIEPGLHNNQDLFKKIPEKLDNKSKGLQKYQGANNSGELETSGKIEPQRSSQFQEKSQDQAQVETNGSLKSTILSQDQGQIETNGSLKSTILSQDQGQIETQTSDQLKEKSQDQGYIETNKVKPF